MLIEKKKKKQFKKLNKRHGNKKRIKTKYLPSFIFFLFYNRPLIILFRVDDIMIVIKETKNYNHIFI